MLRCGRWISGVIVTLTQLCQTAWLPGDELTFKNDTGQPTTVQAHWWGEGSGSVALLRASGRIDVISQERLISRKPNEAPAALGADELATAIQQSLQPASCRAQVAAPFVLIWVGANGQKLNAEIEPKLVQAGKFLQTVANRYAEFAKKCEIPWQEPTHFLPVLIFEHDSQFDDYAKATILKKGLSPKAMSGYYDLLSNRLVLRRRECTSYDTPLHEAIHQLSFNTGWLKRLAPVPLWFSEGLATGFEANGEELTGDPWTAGSRYARLALRSRNRDFHSILNSDKLFQGDKFAAQAYADAWALHRTILVKKPEAYRRLARHFGDLQPLAAVEREGAKKLSQLTGESSAEWYRQSRTEITESP